MVGKQLYLRWRWSSEKAWPLEYSQRHISHVVFELDTLPNFSEPRFRELGEQLDARRSEVARRQLQMLRQFHGLGPDYGLALRLATDGDRLRLYVVVRIAAERPPNSPELDAIADRVRRIFPKEYGFRRVSRRGAEDRWNQALDISWANCVTELIKPETPYPANLIPYFYSSMLWRPQALNDLEVVCRTLLTDDRPALVDVTLMPAQVDPEEQAWVDRTTQRMREAVQGDRLLDANGRTQQTYEPILILQSPVENYEAWMKRYPESPVFLYAIRVFSTESPVGLAQSLSVSASKSQPQILQAQRGEALFQHVVDAAWDVRVSPEVHNPWWDQSKDPRSDPRPWRAQRLHRLADLEEIAPFWRLPIPMRSGFPGFELDTGTAIGGPSSTTESLVIHFGSYGDSVAQSSIRAEVNQVDLVKHGLIVGVPGSGKTTAVFNILSQLWDPQVSGVRVPFMVLEPAKTEYRALKTLPGLKDDLLVFTLGDERISPFRFNPFRVPEGIALETHIARLNACFVGAFNLFDPLPLLFDQTIREAYAAKGWLDDSVGGDFALEPPTLSDVCLQAESVLARAGYVGESQGNIRAALLQRLNSLRRGSKGRMLDTQASIPFDVLMQRPVILELDALNGDEKALLMMFILTSVYEYAKSTRRSGAPLSHLLVVEEAHNLIGRSQIESEHRANPQVHAVRLFTQMLAEMRALGQGILIADQLPTAIAPEAMKQTNIKMLMRMTALDDRTEMGNTMDLDAENLKAVTRFKTGQAYIYHEELDRVRQITTVNFKDQNNVAQPPSDDQLRSMMLGFELAQPDLYMPFPECSRACKVCLRRVRSQADQFLRRSTGPDAGTKDILFGAGAICGQVVRRIKLETLRIKETYGTVDSVFPYCAFVHVLNTHADDFEFCRRRNSECKCKDDAHEHVFEELLSFGKAVI